MKYKNFIFIFMASIIFTAVDQFVKLWAFNGLRIDGSITVIPSILEFYYLENRGAAFGVFQGNVLMLSVFTAVIIVGVIFYVIKNNTNNIIFLSSITLIISGGIGNLIDRVFRGFVVDYIKVLFIKFPIFNLADIFVFCGACLLVFYVIFIEGKVNDK